MAQVDLRKLLDRLTPFTRRLLETAAGLCTAREHYEVTIEHVLLVLTDEPDRDLAAILRRYEIEPSTFKRALQRTLEGMRSGNPGRPAFSPLLVELLTDSWMLSSVDLGLGKIRSGAIVLALVSNPSRFGQPDWFDALRPVVAADLKANFAAIVAGSSEEADAIGTVAAPRAAGDGPALPSADSMLGRFTINFTAQARAGKIDPVFCRDREIQQMIDVLGRRRKNNPICVGEPGVGKTAVVEGLARKIVEGDVPDFLREVELLGLDLGMLQAGASVKGEFENRLKGVIDEVKGSAKPIVLFIDEAHTLVGAGGSAGGSDAANLLKPALARGELRTIAATTWSEYKKYFEKDPALARRFQLVKLDEPSPDEAVVIIRGLRDAYEKAHGVYIRDVAVVAAARLSARYITGRQLPDKAVDVLDTACARVKLSLSTKPAEIDEKERRIATLQREHAALERDNRSSSEAANPRLAEIDAEIAMLGTEIATMTDRWTQEKQAVEGVLACRAKLREERGDDGRGLVTPESQQALSDAMEALRAVRGRRPLVHYEVTPDVVGQVIADWTGISVGSMVRDEAAAVLSLGTDLKARIRGQDQAVTAIDEGLRAAKAGVQDPNQPMGVFLFVGPSGVGKTELAIALSDLLFGGERFLITINMSEFQEKHTVSKLVGSPPGYVGYGEGGLLTEAVRQRPYSVVLLDEVEKADLEVMNLFYQVFDKGVLSDGEGRAIDFKNTIVILTSNLATDIVTEMGLQEPRPSTEDLIAAIRPTLSRHFKPALLARMQIVPFFPLAADSLIGIVRLKLARVAARLAASQKLNLTFSDALVERIVARCTEVETGARAIDHIIRKTILPMIATEILHRMSVDAPLQDIALDVGPSGDFVIAGGENPLNEAA